MPRKKEQPKKQVNARLALSLFKKVEQLAQDKGITTTTMAAELVDEAIRNREESHEEALLRLLTHFDEKMAARITALNHNLRQATGMLLTPKPPPQKEPNPERRIDTEGDARKWVRTRFENIPE